MMGDRINFSASLDQPAARVDAVVGESPEDRRFLRALALDLFGRSPLPSEQDAARGQTRRAVATAWAGCAAFFRNFYENELFYFLLIDNFRPSTALFEELPGRLESRQMSVKEALRQLVSSQFFNARNPGNDTFVTVVMEQLLGITVQKEERALEAGKRMYDGQEVKFLGERGSSQADLVRIAIAHTDFEGFLLGRQFAAMFAAEMPLSRRRSDALRLQEDPLAYPSILADWTCSAAYEERRADPMAKTDRQFVQSLFVDLLGREPTYQEQRRCRNALLALSDSGPLRSVLIKLILDSELVTLPDVNPERRPEFLREQFVRFLCRLPSAQEVKLFAEQMARKSCTPRTVLRALLTHWEYQRY